MSRGRTLVLAMAVWAAGHVAAQAPAHRAPDPEWIAPAEAASKVNPLADRPEAAGGGRKLFAQRCGSCHGAEGRGSDRAPDLTTADVQSQTDGALFWKISGGNTRAGMPAFSFLPELQRWQLVLHMRELARDQPRAR